MEIKYCTDEDIINDVSYFVDENDMLEWFESIGELSGNTYAEQVYDMCNLATAWMINKFTMFDMLEDITIHEGVFGMMGNHTWLQVGDVIIDPTLQQFLLGADRLSVIEADWKEYHSCKQYEPEEWLNTSPNLH